jgi:hypothetical protein
MLSGEKSRRGRKPKQALARRNSDDLSKLEDIELHCPEKAVEVTLPKEEAPRTETAD